jgi:hypothetical protein
MPAQALLTAGDPARVIARWRSCAAVVTARLGVSGDVVALDADGSGPLDVADVIYCRERPAPWLSEILDRYPGCAVAATGVDRGCLVACRTIAISFFNPITWNELGFYPLICALFVHGWRTAGWPLAALDPRGLVVTAEHVDSVRAAVGNSATPIQFALYYESRCRISSASGAPTSE